MPPHKQPRSLSSLSTSAVEQLVVTSLLNMAAIKQRPWPFRRFKKSPVLQEALDRVQKVLVYFIPPSMWDSLFEAVLQDRRMYSMSNDNYLRLYSIFCHGNLKKLKLYRDVSEKMVSSNLKNVVELDISFTSGCNLKLLTLIGQECLSLQTVKLFKISVPESYNALAGCTGLKSLSYQWIKKEIYFVQHFSQSSSFIAAKQALDLFPCLEHYSYHMMGNVLLNLNTTKTLNLRSIREVECRIRRMNTIIALCPHLQHLEVTYLNDSDSCHVFEALAASLLEIRELKVTVTSLDENFKRFMEKKGRHLLKLDIRCLPIPKQAAQLISKYCSRLTHLKLKHQLWFNPNIANTLNSPEKKCQSSMANLEKLSIEIFYDSVASQVELLEIFLPRNSSLSSLKIKMYSFAMDGFLIELMKSVKMNGLEDLKVYVENSGIMTDTVLREIFTKFTNLKRLVLRCAGDQSFISCLEDIRREVEDQNLDFLATISDW